MVTIEERTRNLIMLLSWLPSLILAALVFSAIARRRRNPPVQPDVNGTLLALGGSIAALFVAWLTLLTLGHRLICATH